MQNPTTLTTTPFPCSQGQHHLWSETLSLSPKRPACSCARSPTSTQWQDWSFAHVSQSMPFLCPKPSMAPPVGSKSSKCDLWVLVCCSHTSFLLPPVMQTRCNCSLSHYPACSSHSYLPPCRSLSQLSPSPPGSPLWSHLTLTYPSPELAWLTPTAAVGLFYFSPQHLSPSSRHKSSI